MDSVNRLEGLFPRSRPGGAHSRDGVCEGGELDPFWVDNASVAFVVFSSFSQLSCSHTVNSLRGHARCHCACWNQIGTRIVVLLRRVSFFSFLNFGAFSCVWDLNTFAKCVCSPIYALASPRNCITLSVELQFSNQQTSLGFSVADALRLDPRVPRLVLCGWYGLY